MEFDSDVGPTCLLSSHIKNITVASVQQIYTSNKDALFEKIGKDTHLRLFGTLNTHGKVSRLDFCENFVYRLYI